MRNFIMYSSICVKLLYIACLFMLIYYILKKWTRTGIIFSPFNFQIWFFAFTMIFISPFQYNYQLANTWSFFPTNEYIYSLNCCYSINLIGFLLMLLGMTYFEGKRTNGRSFTKQITTVSLNLDDGVLNKLCIIVPSIFIIYVCYKANGIPLLNGNRTFSQNSTQFIFLLLQGMVYILAWYYTGSFYKKKTSIKEKMIMLYLVLALLITANRTFPLKIIYAVLLIALSFRNKIDLKFVFKEIKYVVVVMVAGIIIIIVRNTETFSTLGSILMNSVVYGSTFSDMRDGARVFWGYNKMYDSPLFGLTYLASIISFIPSSLADSSIPVLSTLASFRKTYSGGSWSTLTLFGIENHYGLRGGMFSTAYYNFGFVGVVVIALTLSYWFGNCEILFERLVKKSDSDFNFRKIMYSYCMIEIFYELLYAPAGFNILWGFLVIFIISVLIRGKIIIRR